MVHYTGPLVSSNIVGSSVQPMFYSQCKKEVPLKLSARCCTIVDLSTTIEAFLLSGRDAGDIKRPEPNGLRFCLRCKIFFLSTYFFYHKTKISV